MEWICFDSTIPIYECLKGTFLGLSIGALITMVLYTTGILAEIKKRKSKYMTVLAVICFVVAALCIMLSLIASF